MAKSPEFINFSIHQIYKVRTLDYSHAPHHPHRKVYFGTIHTILNLQKKYPTAGWFRLRGYLLKDHDIELGSTTIKKIMKMNRRLHLVPKVLKPISEVEPKEPPPRSTEPFTYAFIDIRYLDAKPNGEQLYSCLLLEGFSRTILAGSLTDRQHVGVILRLYYLALLKWGLWKTIVSDNGSQCAFSRVRQSQWRTRHPSALLRKGTTVAKPDRKSIRHSSQIRRIPLA